MKTQRGGRRSYKNPRLRSRADNKPSEKRINDLVRAGLLFVLMGVFALVYPVLTTRHHAELWQPMQGARAEDSNYRTSSPVAPDGGIFILVGCILGGLGVALKS